jgi:predicted unusual protein kinase regulating ubiquinone biosynthesis (AarF/ABC1/UbiB family)
VAVKIRHPSVEAAIRSDFRAAGLGTGLAGALLPGVGATARAFVAETQARLLEECDYRLEAERQELFSSLYRRHPAIRIPEVCRDWCAPRVLTTRWEPGQGFDGFAAQATQDERDHAGRALFDFYIGTLYRNGLFHADPHPGNYVFRDNGEVVVFDFGCVRIFEPEITRAFVALADAVRADDRKLVCTALQGLGAEPSTDDASYAQLRQLLRGFFQPMLTPGPRRIDGRVVIDTKQILRDKLTLARLRLPGRLMFLCRIRFGLYAVLSRLGAIADWADLEQGFAKQANVMGGS